MDEGIKRLIELGINASPALRELEKLGLETQKQTDQLNGLQGTLDKFGSQVGTALKGLAIAEVARRFVEGFMSMVDAMDAMDEQAQQLGVTVEKVQELQYAMSFSGIKGDEAVGALGRFAAKLSDISDDSSDTARKLREMGITAGDDVPTALNKMANVFAAAGDGVDKTALAVEIFGRNLGLKLIPFLNEGEKGIARMADEAQAFGIVSEETAKEAAEFNDNLEKLWTAAKGLGNALIAEVLPGLNAFLKWCVDMVGPISKAITFIGELNSKFSAGALAAQQFSLASAPVSKDMTVLGSSVDKFITDMQKTGTVPTNLTDMQKWMQGVQADAKKLEAIPAKIKAIKEAMATPEVANNALAMQSYMKTLKALESQLDASEKKRGGSKAKTQKLDEWTQWTQSVEKAGATAEMVPAKIEYLEKAIASLDTTTQAGRLRLEALQKALTGLKVQDAGDTALKRIADDAEKLTNAPYVMERIADEIAKQEAAGKGASEGVRLLREELLKMQAVKDPVAAVTQELETMHKQLARNAAMEAEFFKRLGTEGFSHDDFVAVNKYLTDTGDKLQSNTDKAKDLGQAVAEMGAKFVTDWVDKVVDGLGKTEVAFSDMVESFLKQLLKLLANQQMAKLISMFTTGGAGGGIGGIGGGSLFGAQGFAFDERGVQKYAQGGILSSPTFFTTGGGRLAVAGEAGPEGVVPLRRDSSGDLGVSASPVTVNIHNNAPVEVTTQTKDNSDGSRQIEVFIEQKVKGMFTNGSMDRTMRQGYGLSRQPISG